MLDAIGDRVAEASTRAHERIDRTAVGDPVTGDLLIEVAGTLEKQLSIRAQAATARGDLGNGSGSRVDDPNGV